MKTYSYNIWQSDSDGGPEPLLDFLRRDKNRKPFITGCFGGEFDAPRNRVLITEEDVLALKLAFPGVHITRSRKVKT